MKVIAAYSSVVLIWATTPLAIKWSNSSLSYIEAVTARMCFAMIGALVIVLVLRKKIFRTRHDWKPMLVGAFKMYPVMLLVYWSAQYIPSGLISVVFGATPFFVGLFSVVILKENQFNTSRVIALVVALVGLVIIHVDQLDIDVKAAWGVLGILTSAMLFAVSTVTLKKIGTTIDPVRQLAGSLLIAAPFFALTWLVKDGELPESIDERSALGVAYLVIAGSILGGLAFYYVLHQCKVATVSLIPLITPVASLCVGYFVDGEVLSRSVLVGAGCVLLSLSLYQGVLQNVVGYIVKIKRRSVRQVEDAVAALIG